MLQVIRCSRVCIQGPLHKIFYIADLQHQMPCSLNCNRQIQSGRVWFYQKRHVIIMQLKNAALKNMLPLADW